MATKSSASELTRLINQLRQERQHHLDSIAEIDQTFKEFGIGAGAAVGRKPGKPGRKPKRGRGGAAAGTETPATARKGKGGRKKAAAAAAAAAGKTTRRRRRKGGAGGKAAAGAGAGGAGKPKSPWGSKFPVTGDELILNFIKEKGGATTEEIRKHWQTSGRKGKAENNLTNLVKTGKLKRNKLEGKPGSNYTLP